MPCLKAHVPKDEANELPGCGSCVGHVWVMCGSCYAKELKMIFLNIDGKYFKNKYRPQLVALHFSLRNIDMVKPEITQVSLANHP